MRRIYTNTHFVLLLLFAMTLPVVSASAENQIASGPTEVITESKSTERPLYGPILSSDPAIRAQIKHLYRERNTSRHETLTRLEELNRAYVTETDLDFRWELAQEMGEIKRSHEIRNIEIGLQLARLNGQEQRAEEFELALDQILNPEKYFPAHRSDPAQKASRIRELSQK